MWGPVIEMLDFLISLGSVPLPAGRRAARVVLGILVLAMVVLAVAALSLAVRCLVS